MPPLTQSTRRRRRSTRGDGRWLTIESSSKTTSSAARTRPYEGLSAVAASFLMPEATGAPLSPENMTRARARSANLIRSCSGVLVGCSCPVPSFSTGPAAWAKEVKVGRWHRKATQARACRGDSATGAWPISHQRAPRKKRHQQRRQSALRSSRRLVEVGPAEEVVCPRLSRRQRRKHAAPAGDRRPDSATCSI